MLEHMRRRRDLVARKSHESVATHLPGDTFDLGYRRAPKPRQDYGLRSAVGAVLATFDEPRDFKRVEQANDGRAVERQGGRELLLPHRRRAAGKMQKRQPGRFRQSERAHPMIDDAAPKPRGLSNLRAEPRVDPAAGRAREGD